MVIENFAKNFTQIFWLNVATSDELIHIISRLKTSTNKTETCVIHLGQAFQDN